MINSGVPMRKILSYLFLLGLVAIFASACSNSESSIPEEDEVYLSIQLRADAGSNQVTLEWLMLPVADTYNIYYMEDDGSELKPTSQEIKENGTRVDGVTANIISAPYTITGLENGKMYWFALSAKNALQDESELTQAIYAIPKSDPPLPAPQNVRANAGDGEVTIIWDTVTGADGYKVFYYTSFTMYGESNKITTNTYTFTGLENGQTYVFFVEALDDDDNTTSGDSSASFIYPAEPSNAPPPAIPSNPAIIDQQNGQIVVEWDTIDGATAYNIYIGEAKGVTKLTGQVTSLDDPDATPKQGVETTLTNGIYYIVVTALNANGESAESREVSIEITDNP